MSLIVPPWGWQFGISNNTGTPDVAVPGTVFTAGGGNSDATVIQVLSALAQDCHYLVVGIGGIFLTASNSQCLLDVLTDPAGGTTWGSFINDLVCGFTPIPGASPGISCWYHFPIYIPAGSAIAVQARTAHSSDITTGSVMMFAYGNPSRPEMWWCGQKVESLGINAASSSGTNITPGATGADGSWTTIGTSTGRYGAVQYGLNGTDGTALARGYFFELGHGSTVLPGAPKSYRPVDATEKGSASGLNQPIWCDVAAGTDWQIRGTCSGTAEVFNGAVYGVF